MTTHAINKVFSTIKRLEYLVKHINTVHDLKVGVNVIYLFYDGFTQLITEMDYIDPYSTPKIKIVIKQRMNTETPVI